MIQEKLLSMKRNNASKGNARAKTSKLSTLAIEPFRIADQTVEDPLRVVESYIRDHGGTIANFDYLERPHSTITHEIIRATRAPWMNSRISNKEAEWFQQRGESAPWNKVPVGAPLQQADPLLVGNLYDAMDALWAHFYATERRGIGVAKVSKVLHLMRPHLYPILDSRLGSLYKKPAREAAAKLRSKSDKFSKTRSHHWEAIRADLIRNSDGLEGLRQALRQSEEPSFREAAERLSDLRLLDIVSWKVNL